VDAAEAKALQQVFGSHLESIASYSIKGAVGNALGGAPAIQVAAAAMGLREGVVPPTVNWSYPDPMIRLNLSGEARRIAHKNAVINAHGLGGENAALVLTKWN
jgi:3-oxoacyl-(acyl-carrier-protein) synthase